MCAEEDWSIFARWRLVMDMTAVTGRTIDEPRSGRQTVIIMDHDYTQDVSCVALLSMTSTLLQLSWAAGHVTMHWSLSVSWICMQFARRINRATAMIGLFQGVNSAFPPSARVNLLLNCYTVALSYGIRKETYEASASAQRGACCSCWRLFIVHCCH